MNWDDANREFVKRFQSLFGLEEDGKAGTFTHAALTRVAKALNIEESLYPWRSVIASSFADPADIRRFQECKAQGKSDQECFKVGDNGIGAWGHNTAQEDEAMCALPRDDWKIANKKGGDMVAVRYKRGAVMYIMLADSMPARKNIKNGAGIDLNPAALKLFGLKPPILMDGFEWSWA